MTILYVDDDEDDRDIFCEAAQYVSVKFECITAGSGRQALEIINQKHIDVIFLDFQLQGVNGGELLKVIKLFNRNIRVYLYSTFMQDFEIENCKTLGAVECLKKPGNIEEITRLIEAVLN